MIWVFGSIGFDIIASGARLPAQGETVIGTSFATAAGNKGANQAVAALRAGAEMKLVGCVGKDDYATGALAELTADGADLSRVRRVDATTGIAVIMVGGGDNMIVIVPGANLALDPEIADQTLGEMQEGDILVLQEEIPAETNRHILAKAKTKGVTTILNTAPFSDQSAELAALAAIVVANETEFDGLTGTTHTSDNRSDAIKAHAVNGKQTIIVTLGPDGAIAATPEGETISVPAPQIEPIDTVGAGDTFCGYLAAGLGEGLGLKQAMARAVQAGSLACLKPGAQPSIPYAREVDAR